MEIIVLIYLISSIIIYISLRKVNMNVARKLYVISIFIILLIYSFITDDFIFSSITRGFMPDYYYRYIHLALNNTEYIYSYLVITSIITIIQIGVSISLKARYIIKFKYQKSNKDNKNSIHKDSTFFCEKSKDERLLIINKVYKDLCKMMN